MIFYKKMLIEIGNNKVTKMELGFLKKQKNQEQKMVDKNLYIVIYGEEVYIKRFNLPKSKGELLYNLVKNELGFSMGNINNILFDYKITKYMNSCVEVIVFYVNSQKIAFIKENNCYRNIKKISLIQFAMNKYYRKSIRENNYIMAFIYEKAFYILAVCENTLVGNSVTENIMGEEGKILGALEIFINKYSEQFSHINNIYLANLDLNFKDIKTRIFKDMIVKVLDKYEKEKLVHSFL